MSESPQSWSPEPSLGDSDDGRRGIGIVHGGYGVYDLFSEERVSATPSPRVMRKEAGKRLGEGETRRLEGLVRRRDLNGLRCVVQQNDSDTKKCIVSLPSGKQIRVRYENLAVESPSPSPDRGPPGFVAMFVSPSDDEAGNEEQGGEVESSADPIEPIRQAVNDGCFVATFPPNPSGSGFRASWELTSDEEQKKQESVQESTKELSPDDVPLARLRKKRKRQK